MDKAIVVVFAAAGMLGWIASWVWFALTGVDYILRQSVNALPNSPIKVIWLQDPIGALRESINSETKGPYIFWTASPFALIVVMMVSWAIAPNSPISYTFLLLSLCFLLLTEFLTEETLQQRVLRGIAYVFLILAMIFFALAMEGQGKFVETFAANFATEFGSLAIALLFLDELYRWRDRANQQRISESIAAERKRSIIQQMASRSNDFALEATRIALIEGWLKDGSLEKVTLFTPNLESAHLLGANLKGAKLIMAHLKNANLSAANLEGASLQFANLTGALLPSTNLKDANLHMANLENALLIGAYLENANLRDTNFQGAKLVMARFPNAKYNSKTVWPHGFTPPPDAINVDEQQQQANSSSPANASDP